MDGNRKLPFDSLIFLSTAGPGRKLVRFKSRQSFFLQGSAADSVFYIHSGRAKLTVISNRGKEATVSLLKAGDFVGEESIAGEGQLHVFTASAITVCVAMQIDSGQMLQMLHEEHDFSDLFLGFMVARGCRGQADLIDQLFNSSEKRLARTLLLMAEYGKPGEPEAMLPPVSQETLAEMIGTTRSRVSFFMNRFRKLGYISYNSRIRVHKSLLNMLLHDEMPEQNASTPNFLNPPAKPEQHVKRVRPA